MNSWIDKSLKVQLHARGTKLNKFKEEMPSTLCHNWPVASTSRGRDRRRQADIWSMMTLPACTHWLITHPPVSSSELSANLNAPCHTVTQTKIPFVLWLCCSSSGDQVKMLRNTCKRPTAPLQQLSAEKSKPPFKLSEENSSPCLKLPLHSEDIDTCFSCMVLTVTSQATIGMMEGWREMEGGQLSCFVYFFPERSWSFISTPFWSHLCF